MTEQSHPDRFLPEVHKLRGIAILLVVLSHTLVISRGTEHGLAIYSALRGATWPFVFIAGFLFAHLHERYDYVAYLRTKARNVIAPYAIIVSGILALGLAFAEIEHPLSLPLYYLLGFPAASPLWFIPMIVLFFLFFPLYRDLCGRPRALLACTAIALAVAIALGRPAFHAGPVINFVYFQSAYLCGLAWRMNRPLVDRLVQRNLPLIILALVLGVSLCIGDPERARQGQIFSMLPLTVLLMAVLREESSLDPLWNWLSTRSFGIFFLHGVVTNRLPAFLGNGQNVICALVFGLALTLACGLVVSAIKGTTGSRSRVLIGS